MLDWRRPSPYPSGMFQWNLRSATPPEWVEVALSDFDAFLLDHASCERKASAVGMSFVARYPERTELIEPMIQFAREELEHFHQVYRQIQARGLQLLRDEEDIYVNHLMKHVRSGREERFLDRLLASAVIEARGCERLAMVGPKLDDPKLRHFYDRLARAEGAHKDFFVRIACMYFTEEVVRERLEQFLDWEAEAIASVPHSFRMH